MENSLSEPWPDQSPLLLAILEFVDGFSFIGYLKFVINFMDVLLDRTSSDSEQIANFFIKEPFGEIAQDLLLPLC